MQTLISTLQVPTDEVCEHEGDVVQPEHPEEEQGGGLDQYQEQLQLGGGGKDLSAVAL